MAQSGGGGDASGPRMQLQVHRTHICDDKKRQVVLRGLNVDGMAKMPSEPHLTTFDSDPRFWDGDNVSFIGRPFSLEEAGKNFALIKSWGFNTIRYVFTWEAIEHAGPKKYDHEFIDFTIKMLQIATDHQLYVFMDPHQDVWGRFSGGSGAPMWTYYAAGLEPRNFAATRAAVVQNTMDDPDDMPKMLWPTNYYRLACQVMFTLFFGGRFYAPKAILDGQNIQDYLQTHLIEACLQLYKKIAAAGLFERGVFGIENMNEPNMGIIGLANITKIPENQNLRLCSTPTAFQSMVLGTGVKQKVENYSFGSFGPKRKGMVWIDPQGASAWIQNPSMDEKYGFKRGPEWQLGRCIWAQHGVWDDTNNTALLPGYFGSHEDNTVDETYAVNVFFREYWRYHMQRLRAELPNTIFLLCQPPTLAKPPNLKGTDLIDGQFIYAPHFYDGLTLMLKRWSSLWNVDALGYLRGNYKWPVMALKVGESSIRHSLAKQLNIIAKEKVQFLGNVPLLMSETGIPMDMNDRESFLSNDYTSQIKALDALISAIESHLMHVTYWTFSSTNTNLQGDQWNREDFSFLSASGPRAQEAFVRPAPEFIVGTMVRSRFHLSSGVYELIIDGDECSDTIKTEVYVPGLHFGLENHLVTVTNGTYEIEGDLLEWCHPAGRQILVVEPKKGHSCCIS